MKKAASSTKEPSHKVDIVVTIEKAISYSGASDGQKDNRKRHKSNQTTKSHNFFHAEYRLLPTDVETTKADVVTFGSAAKVYMDSESKVLRSWREGDLVYFSWSQKRRVEITTDLLTALFRHKVELQILEGKGKVSARAKFDRPKTLRSPQQQLPSRTPSAAAASGGAVPSGGDPSGMQYIPGPPSPSSLSFPPSIASHLQKRRRRQQGQAQTWIKASSPGSDSVDSTNEKDKKKSRKSRALRLLEEKEEERETVLCVPMARLFTRAANVQARLESPVGALQDARIIIDVSGSLMTEKQRKMLNPLAMTIRGATNMPDHPTDYSELRRRCLPAYACYQFFEQLMYKTVGRPQDQRILWEDTGVVLAGLIDSALLIEWLCGPPLIVEVHDRDRKYEGIKPKPIVFGELENDKYISGAKDDKEELKLTHNPFKEPLKPWDPYGIAKFDLSGLLRGECLISISSPILNCPRLKSTDERLWPNDAESPSMLPGNYLDAGSELKMKIELSHPLVVPTPTSMVPISSKCPFSRLVFSFPAEADRPSAKQQLLAEITSINAAALGFDKVARNVVEVALSTYKLSSAQKIDPSLDIMTGFQVVDGNAHLVVLEGLALGGIQSLWNAVPHPEPEEDKFYQVLYNSSLTFSKRLYADLDMDLCTVYLYLPIVDIITQPAIYLKKDEFPPLCFEALINLNKLAKSNQLIDASRSDSFPSAEMILALSQKFGLADGEKVTKSTAKRSANREAGEPSTGGNKQAVNTSRLWTPICHRNLAYEKALAERESEERPDHLKQNILNTRTVNTRRRLPHIRSKSEIPGLVAYNYSSQALNSTEIAKHRLRRFLDLERGSRFTYCQDYNAMTLEPFSQADDLAADLEQREIKRGFVFPGPRTSLECNQYPVPLDDARKEQLLESWEENVLHSNKLRPTVDRMRFSWPQRREDMDLLTKPSAFFGNPMPVSMHTFDEDGKEDDDDLAVKTTTLFKTHRLSIRTELISSGPKSSNQLDRLTGLLKDSPRKMTLRINPVPQVSPLSTIVETDGGKLREKNERQGYHPGPFEDSSWAMEKNKIPIAGRDKEGASRDLMHSSDFRLWHHSANPAYKRPIEPLSGEERKTHLFLQNVSTV